MHIVVANTAFDIPSFHVPSFHVASSHSSPSHLSHRAALARRMTLQSVSPSLQVGAKVLGTALQSVLFCAVLWMLVAAPGFLFAQDSLVPSATGRAAPQASR